MKICILVPSEENYQQAGVRIRYRRIEDNLVHLGHELNISAIQNFNQPKDFIHDVYIISKCYDARGLLAACLLSRMKKIVGVDLFDDYYSQLYDSRFDRLRLWLLNLLQYTDFILCSTLEMRGLAERISKGQRIHVMNDPAPPFDEVKLRSALKQKIEYLKQTGIINIGWFGIGDNPYFPVGLHDLVAFGSELSRIQTGEFKIQLEILTNKRAMIAEGLAGLRRLTVPYKIEEWTEKREEILLENSIVCFLPVNAQRFSIVKSLNRAFTSLCSGVQVLSSGYPLYESLSPLIYRDPMKLLNDIKTSNLALREDSVRELIQLVKLHADPLNEAKKFTDFLSELPEKKFINQNNKKNLPFAAVIHGKNSITDVHKFTQRMGCLSVSSPYCKLGVNFDMQFAFADDGLNIDIYLYEKYCSMINPELQKHLTRYGKILDRAFMKLESSHILPDLDWGGGAYVAINSPMNFTCGYTRMMKSLIKAVRILFPDICCILSEHSGLPFQPLTCENSVLREAG